ncbi:MAG: hypothetical protein WD688_21245 [Candidatus Binatia bacterium]
MLINVIEDAGHAGLVNKKHFIRIKPVRNLRSKDLQDRGRYIRVGARSILVELAGDAKHFMSGRDRKSRV